MKSKYPYRIGGISAYIILLITLLNRFESVKIYLRDFTLFGFSSSFILYILTRTLFIFFISWALYHLFSSKDRRLSLSALISNIFGIVLFLLYTFSIMFDYPDLVYIISAILSETLPALLFGILAFKNVELGIARPLAIASILYATTNAIIYILWGMFPDLSLGFIDYLPIILDNIWLAWIGSVLLFGKFNEISD